FESFSQANTQITRKYGGTGLGLAISRKFCQMMGGDLQVSSDLGKGSKFTVRLPAEVEDPNAKEQADVGELAAEAGGNKGGTTLLVIDDDPAVRDLMVRALGKEGYRVETASSGAQGLQMARELKPEAITLDVMMPGMDGWAVLTELKADRELADIPVIMMTMVDDRNMGFALGAVEYLTKPIDWARLGAVLSKYRRNPADCEVLVVEDDAVIREMLRRALTKERWQVCEAENGLVALERLKSSQPAVILLDLMMPQMDGFEFLDHLRRQNKSLIPVIVITSKDLTQEDCRRLNGRVQKVVQKGAITREQLLREVRGLLLQFRRGAVRQAQE
ncbi:MAG: response regulator, partial [Verrucomicrobiota bacterium]